MPVRILLVDDDDNSRSALRALTGTIAGLQIVGEAVSGEHAFQLTQQLEPDLVLMDWRLPGMDGIVATRQIQQAHPYVAVLMVSGSADPRMRRAATAAGAAAVLDKGDGLANLLPEILAAMAKKREAGRAGLAEARRPPAYRAAEGKVKWKVLPRPSVLSAQAFPPWRSAMERAMNSPRPRPAPLLRRS